MLYPEHSDFRAGLPRRAVHGPIRTYAKPLGVLRCIALGLDLPYDRLPRNPSPQPLPRAFTPLKQSVNHYFSTKIVLENESRRQRHPPNYHIPICGNSHCGGIFSRQNR